ncbi:hypothetical protein GCM10027290_02470 [Micromonospora sonneratiae]|uniref:PLD-like domain-containing protein n=1 Tax=Micromonospora sonneratiae TaxID=1184706 RepID=A0ABW3Y729_9ACTN
MSDHPVTEPSISSADAPVDVAVSPLGHLFAEERHGDRQAREAVFCTFNADLGFFERTVLGVTQATGARITVLGDARMSNPDPRAARNAGTRYVHGIAVTGNGSAFHPKLMVVAGPERVVLAIGSGNLSVGGWHLNTETWTVTTADRQRCPALVPEAAAWLRTLGRVCTITPGAVAGLHRTAETLDTLASHSQVMATGHRLVHNSEQSIITQLPSDPVEELLLHAPFHDDNAAAIHALVRRLAPGRVTLAVQSGGRTVIQPQALARVFDELAVPLKVVEDRGKAYRHGKLIEARTVAGHRWTLTGSPNLSAAALLRSVADGGNVELGVLAQPSVSLFPDGTPITLAEVPAMSITSPVASRATPSVFLVEAVRSVDGLRLTLARPPQQPVQILASPGTDYDTWNEIGTVPAGSATCLLQNVDLPGGCRVRPCWQANGIVREGPLTFVTDPVRVRARIGDGHTRHDASPGPIELLGDARLIERWLDAVQQYAAATRAVTLPRIGATGPAGVASESGTAGPRIDSDSEDWLTYSDDAKSRLGGRMFRFALGVRPTAALMMDEADPTLLAPTDRLLDERTTGLQDDDPNSVDDDTAPAGSGDANGEAPTGQEPSDGQTVDSGDDRRRLSPQERRRIRRRLWRAAHEEAPDLPAIDRLTIGTLVLVSIDLGIWDSADGDDGWAEVLATLLTVLDLGDVPTEVEASAASFAAVAIYLIRDHLPVSGRTREVIRYEAAAEKTAHLYPAADLDLIGSHSDGLHNSRGFPVDPDEVVRVISMIVQDDPLADAIEVLGTRHGDWTMHRHQGAVLHVHGAFRNPFTAAAEALDAADRTDMLAVWATNTHGGWALAVRSGQDLFHIELSRGLVMWRHYRLGRLTTATRLCRDSELASRLRVSHGPLTQPIPGATTAFLRVGLDVAHGPPDCF